jgi:hypothetical protein
VSEVAARGAGGDGHEQTPERVPLHRSTC